MGGPPSSDHHKVVAGRNRIEKLVTRLVIAQLAFFVSCGWLFRATLYWTLPVVPDNPAGLGDFIDYVFFLTVLGSSALALAASLVLALSPALRRWASIAALVCGGLLATPVFVVLHPHVPQLMGRR